MKKYTVPLIIIAVLALVAGGNLLLANQDEDSLSNAGATVHEAWIEVTSEPVYRSVAGERTVLKSGATVAVGDVIETGSTGTAIIHFPDASLARIDVDTTLTLSALSFNTDDDSLVVTLGLSIGRVWSKVIGLATPESSWEVQTSNTVATVRGTAFGVGYRKEGLSWVLGSENTVSVAPINPKTKEKIASAEVLIGEDRLIQIDNRDAAVASTAIGSSTVAAKITAVTSEFRTSKWVLASQAADKKLNEKIEALRQSGLDEKSMREELLKENTKLKDSLTQAPEITQEDTREPEPTTQPQAPTNTTAPSPTPSVSPSTNSSNTVPATGKTTTISASRSLTGLVEDDTIQFKAIVGTGSDARDITREVVWRVNGSIGSITTSGFFTSLLGSDVSEFGQGTGSVSATLPNGDVVQSASIFVKAKIPTGLGTEG